MRKLLKNRGYTDKLYFYNFCTVNAIIAAILIITALGGVLGLTDLSPLADIPQWAYGELGIGHTYSIDRVESKSGKSKEIQVWKKWKDLRR